MARDELLSFDDLVGPGRVLLTEVAFGEVGDFYDGSYKDRTGEVLVSEAADSVLTRRILRHELCHAIDFQDGLVEERVAAFDLLAEGMYGAGGVAVDAPATNDRHMRSEALAQLCERGPFTAVTLQVHCPGEDPNLANGFRFVRDEVWADYISPQIEPHLGSPVSIDGSPYGATSDHAFSVSATELADVIYVRYGEQGDFARLYTGERWMGDTPSTFIRPTEVSSEGIPEDAHIARAPIGSADGPALAAVMFTVAGRDTTTRLIYRDAQTWAAVQDACVALPDDAIDLFLSDGLVWYAWIEGSIASWVTVGP